jgi:hypothetical protein
MLGAFLSVMQQRAAATVQRIPLPSKSLSCARLEQEDLAGCAAGAVED